MNTYVGVAVNWTVKLVRTFFKTDSSIFELRRRKTIERFILIKFLELGWIFLCVCIKSMQTMTFQWKHFVVSIENRSHPFSRCSTLIEEYLSKNVNLSEMRTPFSSICLPYTIETSIDFNRIWQLFTMQNSGDLQIESIRRQKKGDSATNKIDISPCLK